MPAEMEYAERAERRRPLHACNEDLKLQRNLTSDDYTRRRVRRDDRLDVRGHATQHVDAGAGGGLPDAGSVQSRESFRDHQETPPF